jgi:hypothetical protein
VPVLGPGTGRVVVASRNQVSPPRKSCHPHGVRWAVTPSSHAGISPLCRESRPPGHPRFQLRCASSLDREQHGEGGIRGTRRRNSQWTSLTGFGCVPANRSGLQCDLVGRQVSPIEHLEMKLYDLAQSSRKCSESKPRSARRAQIQRSDNSSSTGCSWSRSDCRAFLACIE